MIARAQRFANWAFRDRASGRLVIGQWPNWSLTLWLAATVVSRLVHPHHVWATVLTVIGRLALVIWAGDEVLRGVNPWRRTLGAGVLIAAVVGWITGR